MLNGRTTLNEGADRSQPVLETGRMVLRAVPMGQRNNFAVRELSEVLASTRQSCESSKPRNPSHRRLLDAAVDGQENDIT
ncbi:hypothetical protein GCM10009555_087590 [Acrocarpospora macrocephala]